MTSQPPSRPLRVFVTPPSGHQAIPARAETELGFGIHMTVLPTESLFATALSDPESFDLIQAEYWMINALRRQGAISPARAREVDRFDEIATIFTDGEVDGRPVATSGVAPHTVQFDTPGGADTAWLNAVPTICNSDTLGWRADRTGGEVKSWAALLDPRLAGRVALADVPAVSHVELSLACLARGLVSYGDIGEQTRAEIDATFDVAEVLAESGQFHSLWASFEASVEGMTEGDVALQSLWPPAVTALKARGVDVRYGPLAEGARGWAGGFCLSARLDEETRRRALAYANWYLDGWAGAFLMRQGYYCSTPEAARRHMSANEWGYWQHGQPAVDVVRSPGGAPIAQPGERREGGGFAARMGAIACWSARMAEDRHIRARWAAFRNKVIVGRTESVPAG